MNKLLASIVAAAALAPLPAAAQGRDQVVQYSCNVDGMPARMVASIHYGIDGGIVGGGGGDAGAFIRGGTHISYAGYVVSQRGRLDFNGEGGWANFVGGGMRFRAQMFAQGRQLIVLANPGEEDARQYLCMMAG